MREETDAPSEQWPERPVDFRGGHEIDVQEDVDRHEDSGVEIESRPASAGTVKALGVFG